MRARRHRRCSMQEGAMVRPQPPPLARTTVRHSSELSSAALHPFGAFRRRPAAQRDRSRLLLRYQLAKTPRQRFEHARSQQQTVTAPAFVASPAASVPWSALPISIGHQHSQLDQSCDTPPSKLVPLRAPTHALCMRKRHTSASRRAHAFRSQAPVPKNPHWDPNAAWTRMVLPAAMRSSTARTTSGSARSQRATTAAWFRSQSRLQPQRRPPPHGSS